VDEKSRPLWRNGSALGFEPKGCGFDPHQWLFLFFAFCAISSINHTTTTTSPRSTLQRPATQPLLWLSLLLVDPLSHHHARADSSSLALAASLNVVVVDRGHALQQRQAGQ
jgi:hypothetical protein